MGLFKKDNREGGILDVIRCDIPSSDYLIWKWSPDGEPSRKENAIRSNSSLRVKIGQVAAFVYTQQDRTSGEKAPIDFIVGPQDQFVKTANFPVLTSIMGAAYNRESPFVAEVYFINTALNVRLPFFIENMKLATKLRQDISIPANVKVSINFGVKDYENFAKHYSLSEFSLDDLKMNLKGALASKSRSIIARNLLGMEIHILQAQNFTDEIAERITSEMKGIVEEEFGLNLIRVNVESIEFIEDSNEYIAMNRAAIVEASNTMATASVGNQEELLRIQREEMQRRTRLGTESDYLAAHQVNLQADVAKTAATSLGQMGAAMDIGGGLNPAGMMAGMMLGGAVGSNLAGVVGQNMSSVNNFSQMAPPPPPPTMTANYHLLVGGQQQGPYSLESVRTYIAQGIVKKDTYVWKQNTPSWVMANSLPELSDLFGLVPPPPPAPMAPPVPPTAPTL